MSFLEQQNVKLLQDNVLNPAERKLITGKVTVTSTAEDVRVKTGGITQPGRIWAHDPESREEFIVIAAGGLSYTKGLTIVCKWEQGKSAYRFSHFAQEAVNYAGDAIGAMAIQEYPPEASNQPVATKNIQHFRLVANGLAIRITGNAWYYNKTALEFKSEDTVIDLTTIQSAMASGKKRIVIVYLDRSTGAISTQSSSDIGAILPVSKPEIKAEVDALHNTSADYTELHAIILNKSATSIDAANVHDLRTFLFGRTGAESLPDLSDVDDDLNTGIAEGDVLYYDATTDNEWKKTPLLDSNQRVTHEAGGLEADVSAYDGVPIIESGSTSELKINRVATTDPGTGDDDGDGYSVGSLWINVTDDKGFVCLDASAGAAVWAEISIDSLQDAYEGGAEIVTDATNGAVTVQGGTGSDTDTAFRVQNNAGTDTVTVQADGDLLAQIVEAVTKLIAPEITNDGGAIFRIYADNSSGTNSLYYNDCRPGGTGNQALFRVFRETLTTGIRRYQIFVGDNTATLAHEFACDGSDSYVNGYSGAGDFAVGGTSATKTLDVHGKTRSRSTFNMDSNTGATDSGFAGLGTNAAGQLFAYNTAGSGSQLTAHMNAKQLSLFMPLAEAKAILAGRDSRHFIREITIEAGIESIIDVVGMAMALQDPTYTQSQFIWTRKLPHSRRRSFAQRTISIRKQQFKQNLKAWRQKRDDRRIA